MENYKPLSYQDFWAMRARQSIWVTRNISYRAGAWIALHAERLGISPNVISLMSGGITVGSALIAFGMGHGNLIAGLILIIGLQLGYAFDCADGPLARATGKGSSFGALLDKLVDLSSGMVFPCILAYSVGHCYFFGIPFTVRVLILVLILRVFLNVMLWIKELVIYDANRLQEDSRARTLWWSVKKAASIYIDEPVYRLAIGLSWALGYFWEFFALYHVGVLFLTLAYLLSSKKEMDAMDRAEQERRF